MSKLLCKRFGHDWKKLDNVSLRWCKRCHITDESIVNDFFADLRKVIDKSAS